MKGSFLVNLEDAELSHVNWVWEAQFPNNRGLQHRAHIFQFGLRGGFWANDLPMVEPLCGAPAFVRGSHNPIMGAEINIHECGLCLIELVNRYPHFFFTKGGR